jgi:hypothetical protein
MTQSFVFSRIEKYVYRGLGAAFFAALIANIYKHGWHVSSLALGTFLTLLTLSLSIANDRPATGWNTWNTRYLIALLTFGVLFVKIVSRLVLGE